MNSNKNAEALEVRCKALKNHVKRGKTFIFPLGLTLLCLTLVTLTSACTEIQTKSSEPMEVTSSAETSENEDTESFLEDNSLDDMPEPFALNSEGDSEEKDGFYKPYDVFYYSVPTLIMDLAAEDNFDEWIRTFDFEGGTRDGEEFSIVTYVKEFGIAKDMVTAAIEENLAAARKNGIENPVSPLSTEQINAIYGTQTEIDKVFLSEFSILLEGRIYTPEWLYTHSVSDYTTAGLTPQMVSDKLPIYKSIPFTVEAKEAFSEKLTAFTGVGLE